MESLPRLRRLSHVLKEEIISTITIGAQGMYGVTLRQCMFAADGWLCFCFQDLDGSPPNRQATIRTNPKRSEENGKGHVRTGPEP